VTKTAAQHMWKDWGPTYFRVMQLINVNQHSGPQQKGFVMMDRFKREKDLSKN
jgi:hypothetical protein